DQQRGATEESDAFAQPTFSVRLGQRVDDVGERREVDAVAGTDGLDAKRRGQVTLPVPDWPMKWTTSWRPMKSSCARARTRLRSSEGWNEKSKPDKVLTMPRRAICSAALMRRLSRTVISSASNKSIASIALIRPR